MQRPHNTERGPPLDAGQAAGVAVGVNGDRPVANQLEHEIGAPVGEALVGGDVLGDHRHGLGHHGVGTLVEPGENPVDTPGEVHRRRPRRANAGRVGEHHLPPCLWARIRGPIGDHRGEGDAEPSGDAERRRPPYDQALHRIDQLVDRP